jgi:hypothetical protein
MTPRKLYVEQVLPSLAAFLEAYTERKVGLGKDIARGAQLAELFLNLSDYVFSEATTGSLSIPYASSKDYREQYLWKKEPCYELVCDFANAFKHRTIGRQGRIISGIGDVFEGCALCRYTDEEGTYHHTHKIVVMQSKDGKEADLRRFLVAAARLWAHELHHLGLAPETSARNFHYTEHTTRSEAATAEKLTVFGLVGEYMNVPFRSFDFDNAVNAWVHAPANTGFSGEMPLNFEILPSPFASEA